MLEEEVKLKEIAMPSIMKYGCFCLILLYLGLYFLIQHISKSQSKSRIEIAKLHQKDAMFKGFYEALFVYYIDNGRFPTEEEGLLYGLMKTGKNAPYFLMSKNKEYLTADSFLFKENVRRKDGKSTLDEDDFLLGDIYLDPYGKPFTYRLASDKKSFELADRDKGFILTPGKNVPIKEVYSTEGWYMRYHASGSGERLLLSSNLPYLRYKKWKYPDEIEYPSLAVCIARSHIEFYLEKEKSTDKKEERPLKEESKSK